MRRDLGIPRQIARAVPTDDEPLRRSVSVLNVECRDLRGDAAGERPCPKELAPRRKRLRNAFESFGQASRSSIRSKNFDQPWPAAS
jgi:hypothetical protein